MTIKSVKKFFFFKFPYKVNHLLHNSTLANGKWQKSGTGRGGGGISGNCPFKEVDTNKSCLVYPVVGEFLGTVPLKRLALTRAALFTRWWGSFWALSL